MTVWRDYLSLLPLAAAFSACASSDVQSTDADFDSLFEHVATVELEELPGDPIVGITSLARRPSGGFILTDGVAGRVRLFNESGHADGHLGGPGDGPGELQNPTAAIEFADGRVFVTQRANPRLTVFRPDSTPLLLRVPGFYGSWLAPVDGSLAVSIGTREERFALISDDANVLALFGHLDPVINEMPYWIFFALQHAAVLKGKVVTNTSFFPTLVAYDAGGDSTAAFGSPPPSWVDPTPSPVSQVDGPDDRERLEAWAGSFTVVRDVVAVGDTLLFVQYGRHRPVEGDSYFVEASSFDVYSASGTKIVEDVPYTGQVIGGSGELLVLLAEPPEPWTVGVYRWIE